METAPSEAPRLDRVDNSAPANTVDGLYRDPKLGIEYRPSIACKSTQPIRGRTLASG